jgi:hypothetical protein
MIAHLDSRQTEAARRSMLEGRGRLDRSSDGARAVAVEGDRVVLDGALRIVPQGEARPIEATVADNGAIVRSLPLAVDGKHVHWSPDEGRVAFDVRDGERHLVYVYDVDDDRFFPVLPDASVEGWEGPHLRVRGADGRLAIIAPIALDPAQGAGLVFGSGSASASPGEVKVDGDHVDIKGIRVPRRP